MARRTTKTAPATGPKHDGRLIVGKKIELRKVGGEFSEDLMVANPALLDGVKVGSRVTVAVDLVCIDEHFPAEDRKEPDEGGVFHKLVFDPTEVTVIDRSSVAADFDRQRNELQRLADEAAGNTTIDSQLAAQHKAGEHKKIVDGCAECEREQALEAAERAAAGATVTKIGAPK